MAGIPEIQKGRRRPPVLKVALYLIIFAILVPVVFGFLGYLLDKNIGNPFAKTGLLLRIPGFVLAIAGVGVIIVAGGQLSFQGKGLPASPMPPSTLVTNGAYIISRHPIYTGASSVFLGIALLLNSFWITILGWPLFTAFFILYALYIEEPVLEERFPGEYEAYKDSVPLIFPFMGMDRFKTGTNRRD